MPKKQRSNYKTQEDKSILSSSSESEESGTEARRQVYFRSRSRSPTPTVSPDRQKRKRSVSRHRRRSNDHHVRHERGPYQPPPPSYPRSPPPYQPAPPSYERDHRDSYRSAPARYQDDNHKPKGVLPRYEAWSGGNRVIKKRCPKEFSIHSNTPDVMIIGEKREKKKKGRSKEKGEKEKKHPRSASPVAGTSQGTQDEQPPQPPAAISTPQPPAATSTPQPPATTSTPQPPAATSIPQPPAAIGTFTQVAGPSNQALPPPTYSYPPQMFQQSQFHQIPQQANSNTLVMEILKIVKEIMGLAGNIRGGLVAPIPYLRQIKQEPIRPDEIITVEDEASKPALSEDETTGDAGDSSENKETATKENDEKETPGRKSSEVKSDKPPIKKRLDRMIQRVKNDEKDKSKSKPSQPRD